VWGGGNYGRGAKKGKGLNTERTEKSGEDRESGRDLCLRQAGFGQREAKAPASLCKITQGRQDHDACRIVGNANREIGVLRGADLFLGFVVLGCRGWIFGERDCFAGWGAVWGGAEILDWPAYREP
jgi:hypothetical protein